MRSKTHVRRTLFYHARVSNKETPWAQSSFVTPFIRPYKNAKPEQNFDLWTMSNLRDKFKSWHQTYKQLSTRTLKLACDAIHPSAKLSTEILTFSANIRYARSSSELRKDDITLLRAPGQKGKAVDKALDIKITELKTAIGRLSFLPAHDALCLLRNALAMPKLLYILRTAPCSGNPRLTIFDDALRQGLSSIRDVSLTDNQ